MTQWMSYAALLFVFACGESSSDIGTDPADASTVPFEDAGQLTSDGGVDGGMSMDAGPIEAGPVTDCGIFTDLRANFEEDGVIPSGWRPYGPHAEVLDGALKMPFPRGNGAFNQYGQGISANSTFTLSSGRISAKLEQPPVGSLIQTIIKAQYLSIGTWVQAGLNETGGFAHVFSGKVGEEVNDWRDFVQDGDTWLSIFVSPELVAIDRSADGTVWERVLELPGVGEGQVKIHLQSFQQFPSAIDSVVTIEDFNVVCDAR